MAKSINNCIKFLLFSSGGLRWGIDLDLIQVISSKTQLNKVCSKGKKAKPKKFPYAGNEIPLMSLNKRMQLSPSEDNEEEIIIVKNDGSFLGLTVEAIDDVVDLSPGENIFPLPPLIQNKIRHNWIWGVAKLEDQLVLLLEPKTN